ncbi:zinc finger protein [Macleaya cordata]|uniref:Zinc finger protein n=1 Tax=Macleaya cordata TaxID=56857 RepID=A0A200QS82_MACCD|nr:zinc finger protein [Macleaya cordata]
MGSSGASNSAEVKKNNDIAWEWGKCRDPSSTLIVWCKFCEKKMCGGINRLKEHLTHRKGNVLSCNKVPNEVRKKCEELMLEKKWKKTQKQRIDFLFENDAALLSGEMGDDDEEEEDVISGPSGDGTSSGHQVKRSSSGQPMLEARLIPY